MTLILVLLIIFAGVFTQSVAGFGSALVMMPLLTSVIGLAQAAPLVSMLGVLTQIVLMLYFRQEMRFCHICRLIVLALVVIAFGLWFVLCLDGDVSTAVLGFVVFGYAVYALLNLKLPALKRPFYGYVFGFFGGLLAGAFNTPGPPYVSYGDGRQWPPSEFKGNLQPIFFVGAIVVFSGHLMSNNITPTIFGYFLRAIPIWLTALGIGLWLGNKIPAPIFRRLVLVLLVIIGLRLIIA